MNAPSVTINNRRISINDPSYFIADIAANHDGDLQRAKDLIWLAKESGADAAKFQHFLAEKIVSDAGFRALGGQLGHQANWKKSVFEVYKEYELNRDWTSELIETAKKAEIDFLTTPYDFNAVEELDELLPAYKIGSGDITWIEFIQFVAKRGKPLLLATGASAIEDVERAVAATLAVNSQLVLMQCNTNYTGSIENFHYINLNVLKTYAAAYPELILGLSDHSSGHAAVLGAIALGARVIEKHFTDDCDRVGPDHGFAMNPVTWRSMIDRSRELEAALGDGQKKVELNEQQSVVIQQRALYLLKDVEVGHSLSTNDCVALRPAPVDCFKPFELQHLINLRFVRQKKKGDLLSRTDLETPHA
jgi:sialic acid synthase SpsE